MSENHFPDHEESPDGTEANGDGAQPREGLYPGSRETSKKKSFFSGVLRDVASKRLFVFVLLAIAFCLIVFFWPASHKKQVSSVQGAPTLNVPQGSAVPSPAYSQALKAADQQRFKTAEQNGQSSIPTIELGNNSAPSLPSVEKTDSNNSPKGYPSSPATNTTASTSTPKLPTKPVLPAGQHNRAEVPHHNAPNVEVADQNRVQEIQQYMTKLDKSPGQAKLVEFQANQNGTQNSNNSGETGTGYLQHNRAMTGQDTSNSKAATNNASVQVQHGPFKVPAPGTMLYSQLQIGANSDAPGPVMATIMQGPLAGARVLGSFQTSQNGAEIRFSTMTIPYKDSNGNRKTETLGIDAVAISPTRLDDNMATSVNDHLALRLAVAFGTSLLSNFGQLLAQSGASTVISPTGAIATSNPALNTTQQFESAGGQAAGTAGQIFNQEYGNMPPTIKVASGTPFALLFLGNGSAN